MFKATNIIGVQVISVYEGQVEGYVKNLIFSSDYKKLKSIIVCDSKIEEKQYMLDVKDILSLQDIVLIKNSSILKGVSNQQDNSPINLPAFLTSGKKLGIISDVILDEKFSIFKFETSEGEAENNIAKISKDLILFNNGDTNIKYYNCKPKQEKISAITTVSNQSASINIPFLIGKKVIKDIFTFNNEIIIKNGNVVTEKVIQLAKINGKLRELALSI